MREYKELYKYEQYKWRSRVCKSKTQETRRGAWKDRAQDGLLVIHAIAAPLWSATGRIRKLQAPRPGHEDPGESELPASGDANAKWRAKISTCVSKIQVINMH